MWLRLPLTGLAVKSTPEHWLGTNSCTTTANDTLPCEIPFRALYAIARAVHKLLQQSIAAWHSASARCASCAVSAVAGGDAPLHLLSGPVAGRGRGRGGLVQRTATRWAFGLAALGLVRRRRKA